MTDAEVKAKMDKILEGMDPVKRLKIEEYKIRFMRTIAEGEGEALAAFFMVAVAIRETLSGHMKEQGIDVSGWTKI